MFLRKFRWVPAALLAVVAVMAGPARSEAGTQILIQELDGSGVPVAGTTQYFSGTTALYNTPNFQNIDVGATPNSGAINSLTTTVRATPAASFDATHQLRVIVTSDGFTNPFPGGSGDVENNAAASSGIGGGQNILSNTTQLLNVPLSPDTAQTGALATGAPLGAPTDAAIDTRPGGGVSPTTTSTVNNFPAEFAIQQTIVVRANPTDAGGIQTGSTLGGSASSIVRSSAPVPAPAGIFLALAALPVLGLRHLARRRAATAG